MRRRAVIHVFLALALMIVSMELMIWAGLKLTGNWPTVPSIFADVRDPIYKDSCCHLNELGERMLTDAIVRELTENRMDIF